MIHMSRDLVFKIVTATAGLELGKSESDGSLQLSGIPDRGRPEDPLP